MANHNSAAKAARQGERRKQRNRSVKSAVKTQLRGAEEALGSGEAASPVSASISALDRAAEKGVLHPNNVARRKSRLMKKFNAAKPAPAPEPEPAKPAPRRRTTRRPAAAS